MRHLKYNEYTELFSKDPVKFWSFFGVQDGNNWSSMMRFLIKSALVIDVSRAEAERGFSVLTRLITNSRNRFSDVTIEALLRFKINQGRLFYPNPTYFSKAWVKNKHHLMNDIRPKPSRVEKIDRNVEFIDDYEEFEE